VIVVGAGVGGLTLAQGLSGAGIDVVVYEKDDGPLGRLQGIAIHMDERGRSALQANLPADHAAMAEATMGGPREQALQIAEVDGELAVVGSRSSDGSAGGVRPGRQASRPVLRAILLHGLEDSVRFGAELVGYELEGDGTVTARFADGRTDSADVLVGAEGVGSPVRRQYVPQAPVIDTGKRMLMGATPLRAVDPALMEMIGPRSSATVQVDGAMRMALGPLLFEEAPVAARDRLLPALDSPAVSEAEDYLMWAVPASADAVTDDRSPEAVWQVARKLATDLAPTVRSVVNEAWPELTYAHRIGMIPKQPPWPASPVTLIGDAIHLAPGFGANLAMQDAERLAESLAAYAAGEQELLAAIAAYEETMRRDGYPPPPTAPDGKAPGGRGEEAEDVVRQ